MIYSFRFKCFLYFPLSRAVFLYTMCLLSAFAFEIRNLLSICPVEYDDARECLSSTSIAFWITLWSVRCIVCIVYIIYAFS